MPPEPLCKVCQARLDAVLWSVGRHPNCRTAGPLDADALDRLTRYLADALGAAEINDTTQRITDR